MNHGIVILGAQGKVDIYVCSLKCERLHITTQAAQTETSVSLCEFVVEAQIVAPAQYVVTWFVRYLLGVEYISMTKTY